MVASADAAPATPPCDPSGPSPPRQDVKNSKRIVDALSRRGKYDYEMEEFIRDMPKVELHVHLDGAFDPKLLYEHLQQTDDYSRLPLVSILPWDQTEWPVRQLVQDCSGMYEFHALCTCRGKQSLLEMLKCFEIFTPLVRGNLELLEELSYDLVRRQSEQRVVYTEVRYSPHLLAEGASMDMMMMDGGGDPVPVVEAVTRGLRRGEQDFQVIVNQILCCITWRPDWAKDVVDLAHKHRSDYPCAVVGVDIAAGEDHFDASTPYHTEHLQAMKRAQELGICITMHAGEVGGGENVRTAITEYGAKRIGHAYRIDSDLMKELAAKKIHVEVCPTSSWETGGWETTTDKKDWTQHPCVRMLEHGVSVSFNSDDPAVFNTSLSWQYRTVVGKMKLQKETLVTSTRSAIDAAFCSDEEKQRLREIVAGSDDKPNSDFRDRVIENQLVPEESM